MAIVFALSMASYSYADVVLDDFDYSPDSDITLQVNSANPTATTQRDNINIVDGDVVYKLDYVAGSSSLDSSAVSFDPGILSLNNDSTMRSTLLLTYSELAAPGPPTADLSSFDGFYYDLLASDLGFSILVTIGSGAGTDTSTLNINSGAIAALTRTNVLFTDFSVATGAGADLAMVDYVSILISSTATGVDLELTEFGVTNVPEPASMAIFGLSLIGLAFSARKKV